MMAAFCYVYAIVRRATRIPSALAGIGDAPLATVMSGDLAAVISPIGSMTLPATPEFLLGHEAVVEALSEAGQALPTRFGSILAGRAAVAAALAAQSEALLADLARVGDKVELGLTILWGAGAEMSEAHTQPPARRIAAAPASDELGAGRRYLEARLAQYQRETSQQCQARAIIAQLDQTLGEHPLERRYRVLPAPRLAVRAVYLTQRRHIPDIQCGVDHMRERWPELRWLLSGPWPPYSFVTGASRPFHAGIDLDIESGKAEGEAR